MIFFKDQGTIDLETKPELLFLFLSRNLGFLFRDLEIGSRDHEVVSRDREIAICRDFRIELVITR